MHAPYDPDDMVSELSRLLPGKVRPREPLARHSTFGVGGPVDAWVTVEYEAEIVRLVARAQEAGWPLMIAGNGTNVLYADAGMRGIVAQLALTDWSLEDRPGGALLRTGAGVSLPKLVNDLAERGLSGLEWGAGVPGTVGGAVVSNAGAHGGDVSKTLQAARVLFVNSRDEAASGVEVCDLDASELALTYRDSRFRSTRRITFDDEGHPTVPPRLLIEPPEMILGGTFALVSVPPDEVRARVAAYRQHRKETQPTQGSAGSVFKNPPGDYSGRLIEAAGLKGTRVGNAEISPVHANFIVNMRGATAADVVALIALARRTVRERFGVELELEVELRGDWQETHPPA